MAEPEPHQLTPMRPKIAITTHGFARSTHKHAASAVPPVNTAINADTAKDGGARTCALYVHASDSTKVLDLPTTGMQL